jgi:hypothetical protein
MNRRRPSLLLAAGLGLAAFAGAAPLRAESTVAGRVALPKPLAAPVMNQRYGIVASGGVLSPYPPVAVVYLEGAFPPDGPRPEGRMAQQDFNFVPMLLPIRVGTRVSFPNLDPVYHNIFSFSPAKRFDLGRYRSDERPIPSVLFDQPGLVTLRCDIHEHMRGLILVLATPYFVLSGPDGRYRLAGLPSGHYRLKAWIDSRTTRTREVDLDGRGSIRVDFP